MAAIAVPLKLNSTSDTEVYPASNVIFNLNNSWPMDDDSASKANVDQNITNGSMVIADAQPKKRSQPAPTHTSNNAKSSFGSITLQSHATHRDR